MKIRELFYDLCAMAPDHDYTNTCDTCKIGDPDAEITGVAVAMIPTPKVMREASRRGAVRIFSSYTSRCFTDTWTTKSPTAQPR